MRGGVRLISEPEGYECPYCLSPVGYVGRLIAWLVGEKFHDCDYRNVISPPQESDEG